MKTSEKYFNLKIKTPDKSDKLFDLKMQNIGNI